MTVTMDELAAEIRAKLDGIDKKVSEQVSDRRLTELAKEAVAGLPEEEKRKLVFGQDGDGKKLVGTKYARMGLSVEDVEHLYQLQTSLQGQRKVSGGGVYEGPSQELSQTFEAVTAARLVSAEDARELDRKALDEAFENAPSSAFSREDRQLARQGRFELTAAYKRAALAMDTAESGFGSQLIGSQFVGSLWDAPRKLGRVFPLIESFEMSAPTAYLPVEVDIPEVIFVGESTANNSSNYATTKTGSQRVQVDAKKFVAHQMWSGEMEEDAIIPYLPFLRRQAAYSVAHYSDSLVLNGDTTNASAGNINLDDADPDDTKHYLAFNGIRKAGLIDNTGNAVDAAGPATYAQLVGLRSLMLDLARLTDWGHPVDPMDLVYLADPITADALALLDEVISADKYGAAATVFTGELGRVGQNPLISTIALPRTEADGKVSTTAGNNTKGQVVAFNRRGFVAGWRRRVQVETERLPATDQTRIVYSMRLGFGRFTPTGAASGIEAAAVLRNIG